MIERLTTGGGLKTLPGGQALPFLDTLEAAFGQNLSRFVAHLGLGDGVRDTGAGALASGGHAAFADASPDLEQVASEVSHLLQEENGTCAAPTSRPGDAAEHEAHSAGKRVAAGQPAEISGTAGGQVQGDWFDWLDDLWQGGGGSPCTDALQEADQWVAGGPYGPQDDVGAGGIGGFRARYDPAGGAGTLTISQNVSVTLKDTLLNTGGTIAPHPDLPASADLVALAAQITALPAPQQAAALAEYQWPATDRVPGGPWLTEMERLVEDSWGGQHTFFLNKPRWDWIGAAVDVDLNVGLRARGPDDHMAVESYKVAEGESLRSFTNDATGKGISHNVDPNSGTDALDQTMRLASTSTSPKEYALLEKSISFENNSAQLSAAAQRSLTRFIATFDGAVADPRHQEIAIALTAHTSSSGSEGYNQRLATQRAEAVKAFLRTNGFHNVNTRITDNIEGEASADQGTDQAGDRRVDLVVDGGARMITANHEWGHAFGLDDEYGTVGTDPDHNAMVQNMTDAAGVNLPGAVREHNGGIMSYGNEVRPQHYATFHNALQTITAQSPWALGTRRNRADVEAECNGG